MLVVDASVALRACGAGGSFQELGDPELVAPSLMWSEARSSLHEALWRGDVSGEDAERTREHLESCPVERVDHDQLGDEAWRIAEELGWAKTYDAEYLALARLLSCRMVTTDGRLRRGADRLGIVIWPTELE